MSTVKARNGAVAAFVVLLVMIVLAVLVARDLQTDPDPSPSPSSSWSVDVQEEALAGTWVGQPDSEQDRMCRAVEARGVEAAVEAFREDAPEFDGDVVARFFAGVCDIDPASSSVAIDEAATFQVAAVVVEAVPPKVAPVSLESFVPEPESVVVAASVQRAAPVSEQPSRPESAQAAAPAPPEPTEHERAVAMAAQYGCGTVPVIAGGTGGNAGWYSYTEQAIRYAPGDRDLRYIIGHECMHARQQWAYGGDANAMRADLESVGGSELVADCMSQALGAGSGYYASDCTGDLGRAAAVVLAGQRWGGGA